MCMWCRLGSIACKTLAAHRFRRLLFDVPSTKDTGQAVATGLKAASRAAGPGQQDRTLLQHNYRDPLHLQNHNSGHQEMEEHSGLSRI